MHLGGKHPKQKYCTTQSATPQELQEIKLEKDMGIDIDTELNLVNIVKKILYSIRRTYSQFDVEYLTTTKTPCTLLEDLQRLTKLIRGLHDTEYEETTKLSLPQDERW